MATELSQGYLSLSVGLDHPGEALGKWLAAQQKSVDQAGKAMGNALAGGVHHGVERAKADTATAERQFNAASKAAQTAATKQEAAARKVQIAEAKLAEARQSSGTKQSTLLTLEDRLETARKQSAKAALEVASADKRQKQASEQLRTAMAAEATASQRAATQSTSAMSRMRAAISGAVARINPFSRTPSDADEAGRSSGRRFGSGFTSSANTGMESFTARFRTTFLGNAAANAVSSGASALGQAFTAGFSRLESIDQATQKLKGLGNSAGQTKTIMDNALASVKGTAYGMGDAATVAATMVAAGIKPGAQLQKTLSLVADSATIAGADMGDMGAIFSKVATSGKLQGDDLQQLGDRGIPIVALLAKTMGKTSAQVYDLASKGKVNFATFQKAMESGMGGAAKTSGDTFTGAMANTKAALGRIGADVLQGAFGQAPDAFKNLTGQIDTLAPKAEAVGAAVSRFASGLADVVKWGVQNKAWILPFAAGITGVVAAWKSYQVVMRAVEIAQLALNVVMNANPIGLIALAVAGLVAAFITAYKSSETFRNIVNGALNGVKSVALSVANWFKGPFVGFFTGAWNGIKAGFTAVGGFFTTVWGGIKAAFTAGVNGIKAVWQGLANLFAPVVSAAMNAVVAVFRNYWNIIGGVLNVFIGLFTGNWSRAWGGLRGIVSGALGAIRAVFVGFWTVTRALFSAYLSIISRIWSAAWAGMKAGASAVWGGIKSFFSATWSGIRAIFTGGINAVKDVWTRGLNAVKSTGTAIMNGASAAIRRIIGALPHSFSDAVSMIGKAWNGLKNVAKEPVKFVVNTVLNNGLISGFNWVASKLGATQIKKITLPKGFANGGYVDLPWSAQNRDPYLGVSPQGAFRFEGEEFIANRAATAKSRGLLEAINSGQLNDKMLGFKSGGYTGGSRLSQIGSAVASAFGKFASPVDWIKDRFKSLGNVVSKFGKNTFTQMIAKVPAKLADAAISKVKSLFDLSSGPSGPSGSPGNLESWRPMVRRALAASGIGGGKADEDRWLRQIRTESDGNPRLVQSSSLRDINVIRGDPARGLVQVPGVTWADFGRDMGPFASNWMNPLKNLIVGMRAANAQHHNWRRVIGFGHGYQDGGTVPFSQVAALSEDGRPELVVGPQMRKLNARSRVFNADQTRALLGQAAALRIVSGRLDLNMTDGEAFIYATAQDAISDWRADMTRMGVPA